MRWLLLLLRRIINGLLVHMISYRLWALKSEVIRILGNPHLIWCVIYAEAAVVGSLSRCHVEIILAVLI
mgnify:CR=1 FL=1